MAPWSKSSSSKKSDEPEPMSANEFISKANDFLNDVEDKTLPNLIPFNRRVDTFGDMLRWAKHARDKRNEMRNHINDQRFRQHQADEYINNLEQTRANMELEISHLHSVRENMVREKDYLADQHARQVTEIVQRQSLETDMMKKQHNEEVVRLNKKHQDNRNELVRQLLVGQRDDQGWPDDKMKSQFRELQRLMELVTAPSNKELLIPSGQKMPSHLDKTDFLGRRGNTRSHLFLQSALWAILRERFFSSPLGFGVFGPTQSQKQLFEMYAAWRKLTNANAVAASPDREYYAVFRQDVHANNWRSSTFQYINVALTSQDQSNSPVARLNIENLNNTVARIMSVLQEVANLSHSTVRSEIEDKVRKMVSLGRDIALQFGIQSACWQLITPAYRETVQIGEKFYDCLDADSAKGITYTVDIVTTPGLQKVGDGRSNMDVQRVVVPCEIYPIEVED